MHATRLRTEYLTTPLGLDIVRPRFSWNCEGGRAQTAYRIVALRDGETVWDSGRVTASRMTNVEYEGVALGSRDRIEWAVTLWDEDSIEGESTRSTFEMGLLSASDWSATWVTGDYAPRRNTRYPVDYFRTAFDARADIARARLYITACGVYEASINGQRVGDFRLAPGSTDYRHRLQYQVYDVGSMIAERNIFDVRLADGWYRGGVGAFGKTNVFGRKTKLRAQLEITYTDGRTETIGTDRTWSWSNDGPVRFADLRDGEIYDARLTPTYRGRAKETNEKLVPTSGNNVPVREHEALTPALLVTPSGQRVLDFGQNIAGYVAFDIKGDAGQSLKLRFGEMLDEAGEFTQSNFQLPRTVKDIGPITELRLMSQQFDKVRGERRQTPLQEVVYTCTGGANAYKTEFAVFGFRYALIETDIPVNASDFRAIAVYSDLDEVGDFSCSNPDVDRLLQNTRWSMKGNFLDVPTDCPTRERLGWTGDAQVFLDTAAHLMDVPAFMRKWLLDVRDGVLKSGKPAAVAPYNSFGLMYNSSGGSVGWGDASVIVPYRLWKRYGDERIIDEFYGLMRGYALFMIRNTGHKNRKSARANPLNKYVYEKGIQLGEWLEPEEFRDAAPTLGGDPQHTEVATAYLHYTMTLMTEVARTLGRPDDEKLFAEYADGAKRAYNALFVVDGTIDTDRQAKLVRPLALGLLEGESKANVQARLVKAVEDYGYRVGTGFLSTPFLLPVLTEAGRADVAYRMLQNDEAPSWIAEVRAGATTVWEDWEGAASQNHYSPGAVCQWLFDTVAGIRIAGENRFTVAPVPGGGLTYARAHYVSPYGTVRSEWETEATGTTFTIAVPPNTTAEIRLPDGSRFDAEPGLHTFTLELTAPAATTARRF